MNSNFYIRLFCNLFILFMAMNMSGTEIAIVNKKFRVGAATANITPHLGGEIIGEWETPPSTHVHDDLLARCLVLDDGTTKLVFVVLDLLGINSNLSEIAKKIIEQNLNIPAENIIISAIHTHSATSAMGENRLIWNQYPLDEYQSFVVRRIADVVQIANNNLITARIGWGIAKAPEHVFVRRWLMKEPVLNPFGEYDKVLMNPGWNNNNKLKQTAKPDPDVTFISVQSTKGYPIALFANYSLHYVGGTGIGDISADYYGMFAKRISELINNGKQNSTFVASMSNGTSGNVNNWDFSAPSENLPLYAKAEFVANDIAEKVFEVYKNIKYYDWVPLRAKSEQITLNVRKPNEAMIERAKETLNNIASNELHHVRERIYAERTLTQLKHPDQINVNLTTFGIGELGVASIPFEVFAETGLEIKSKSPFKSTYVIGLAGGYYGYLPTPEQHELGGYETWLGTNNVEKNASIKIVSQILKQFSNMLKKDTSYEYK